MIQKTKRYARRALLACAILATAGFTLGSASEAEARGCRPYGYGGYGGGYGAYYGGGGYGYGYGYAPRPVVVARPVVYAPVNYGHRAAYGYRGGYRGGFYGGRGVSIGFGF